MNEIAYRRGGNLPPVSHTSEEQNKKILIALSGGVDSSVAALLLQEYDTIGAMMKLITDPTGKCCSLEDAEDARKVAGLLKIPFYVFNFTDPFNEHVIKPFIKAYENGETPNPCIACNRYMKFQKFLQRALELECTHIATGHYARIIKDNNRYLLQKGVDEKKDQSYVLYNMTQKQLSHTIFPLGNMTKEQVRKIAEDYNFITATKRDSQDICFAPDGDYAGFITREQYFTPGLFLDQTGKKLGEHKGIIHYTIGQRKGLGISHTHPLYVCKISDNNIILGEEDMLYENKLQANDINLIALDNINNKMRVTAKIRYAHKPQPAYVWQTNSDTLHIEFDTPQRAITPGQAVVLYKDETIIGGGTIINQKKNVLQYQG